MKPSKFVFSIFFYFALALFTNTVTLGYSGKIFSQAGLNTIGKKRLNPLQIIIPCMYEYTQNRSTFPVGTYPCGIAFDGTNIWVANTNSNSVTRLRTSDGTVLGTYAIGLDPRGVVYDGANIWVA